ncbi:hypothetical protein B0H13DRAFT_2374190 [Mycena leptocephala]|nr:hypothetical protein B0H13DRAFT_2374190 [Mycena leptocephala]
MHFGRLWPELERNCHEYYPVLVITHPPRPAPPVRPLTRPQRPAPSVRPLVRQPPAPVPRRPLATTAILEPAPQVVRGLARQAMDTSGFNTGISLSSADTSLIVAFGDAWSANGAPDGSKPDGPLYVPADGLLIQTGTERMSNGYTWIEWLSMDSSIPLRDYAVPGAVIDKTLYDPGSHPSDFNDQADLFVSQKVQFNPNSTVFAVFLGSEDLTLGTNFETQLLPRLISNVKTKLIDGVVSV